MKAHRVDELTQWAYDGLWGILTSWFRVPRRPPELPTYAGETIESFRPAKGFLKYLKFHFWILLTIFDGAILVGWIVVAIIEPWVGLILAPLALAIAVLPDIVAYLAIHLRYDTTWYVMSPRSIRIRRGIWVIRETTITFENVQNVTIDQGPLQRWFGIADVRLETAGGGSSAGGEQNGQSMHAHQGTIEGIADPHRIRDLILERLHNTHLAGLGDEKPSPPRQQNAHGTGWSPQHISALRTIRDTARQLAEQRRSHSHS